MVVPPPKHWTMVSIDAIEKHQIRHKKYVEVEKELRYVLYAAQPGEVVVVVGPSRSGKSRCVMGSESLMVNPGGDGELPWLNITAANDARNSSFESKPFYCRALAIVKHPLYGILTPDDPYGVELTKRRARKTEPELREALENALIKLNTRYVAIDEAHHFAFAVGGDTAAAKVLDSCKCMAAATKVRLILSAAYPILNLMELSPHMMGRMFMVHLQRYHWANPEDCKEFARILASYDQLVRIDPQLGSLTAVFDFLIRVTLGCVGHLSKLLRAALAKAGAEDTEYLTLRHLEAAAHSDQQLDEIRREIEVGEAAMCKDRSGHRSAEPPQTQPTGEAKKRRGRPFRTTQKYRRGGSGL